ncbi:MAG: precorrin-3B C(17)-methyltransferase [Deltaproteobacteria bacterium]|nr:precorrin-3B C(17)-methyltransferase [Deltaproteobacteria bacterium]
MARVGRLAGAVLAETEGRLFLVGNPKEPCDFGARGFEDPGTIDAIARPFVELRSRADVDIAPPCLTIAVEGEPLAELLADRFLIARNGSVSDRLWRLVIDPDASGGDPRDRVIDARWLGEMPAPVWRIIRDAVLRCL